MAQQAYEIPLRVSLGELRKMESDAFISTIKDDAVVTRVRRIFGYLVKEARAHNYASVNAHLETLNQFVPNPHARAAMLECVLRKVTKFDGPGAPQMRAPVPAQMPYYARAPRALIQISDLASMPMAPADAFP